MIKYRIELLLLSHNIYFQLKTEFVTALYFESNGSSIREKLNHVFDVVILIIGKRILIIGYSNNRQCYLNHNNNIVTDLIKSAPAVHTSDWILYCYSRTNL
jgi:hypothetical protein